MRQVPDPVKPWRPPRGGREYPQIWHLFAFKPGATEHLADRVNHDSPRIRTEEMVPLREAGWTDEQIWYAITVCALFNFYNRWIDATGVHALSDEAHREGAKRSAVHGYAPKQ